MTRSDIDLLNGAIDIHVHSAPSVFHRHDVYDIVRAYRDAGVRAVILKSHHLITTDRATLATRAFSGIDVFGSIVLNYAAGGVNPYAVDAALRHGARKVWFPTIDSHQQLQHFGALGGYGPRQRFDTPSFYQNAEGIYILTDDGQVKNEVMEVLDLIKEHDAILGMGHLTYDETQALVKAARSRGVKKIVIDHPQLPFAELSIEQQKSLIDAGAMMNYCFAAISPKWFSISVPDLVQQIQELQPSNIVLSTDLGQLHNPLPVEGLRMYIRLLLEEGVSEDDIRTMLHRNPAKLLLNEA